MRLLTIALLIVVARVAPVRAHDEATPVIVDTDMALDDVRALALLLNTPDFDIRAIVTSDGASSPAAGTTNVLRILRFLGREQIPVGAGRSLSTNPPPWREQSETLGWRAASLPAAAEPVAEAVAVVRAALTNAPGPVTYLCLGPLTNLADALRVDRELRQRLRVVIWYGNDGDWNGRRDPAAVRFVEQASVVVQAVARDAQVVPAFDEGLLAEIRAIPTPAARLIARVHEDERVQQLVRQGHLRLWDETAALLLVRPSLGKMERLESGRWRLVAWNSDGARAAYLELLRTLPARDTVVMEHFPFAPVDLRADVRPFAPQIVSRYGREEWKAVLLTSELHRHLGTYSILGAKMGIRARELLGASLDDLSVESFAGLQPPLSCFNDGLQVATGASLGRGTIRVATNGAARCEAVFRHGQQQLRLRVKPDVADRLAEEIAALVRQYGGLTPGYFDSVRQQSLRHWQELDRSQIFETITEPEP
ncbi:MAG TPA: nucleoside hydrolase [Verrucomicrobiae bacterium]|nr:nucleoside hydrolase [Verrucomicrobiae bacterium]